MTPLRNITPALLLIALVVIAALPIGLLPDDRFFLPLLPVIAIFAFNDTGRAPRIADWMAFSVGLFLDVLSNGPLGYWALMYLASVVLASSAARLPLLAALTPLARTIVGVIAISVLAWIVASLYFLELAALWPYALGALLASATALLAAPLRNALDGRGRDHRLSASFARGRDAPPYQDRAP